MRLDKSTQLEILYHLVVIIVFIIFIIFIIFAYHIGHDQGMIDAINEGY